MPLRHLVLALSPVLFAAFVLGQEPEKRRDAATYVFLGTVAAPSGDKTSPEEGVLVTVNEIYFQKGKFENQAGRQVEVIGATARLQEKARYVFYADPVRFGQRITVQLVDLAEAPGAAAGQQNARLKQDLGDAYARREIAERVALAPLIVLGTVTDVRPLERARAGESEHDPQFQIARLRIERALKGKPAAAEVEFVFAASKDVQWYGAPKFRPSTRGVFLLQRPDEAVARLGVTSQRFTVLHPLDFRQPADVALVEATVKGGGQ